MEALMVDESSCNPVATAEKEIPIAAILVQWIAKDKKGLTPTPGKKSLNPSKECKHRSLRLQHHLLLPVPGD